MAKTYKHRFLQGARAYLSGPMDFVANRAVEKRSGWRVRVKQFLEHHGVTVFDPWNKPEVRGLMEYGREDQTTIKHRDTWSFDDRKAAVEARAELAKYFWATMHVDLRMVDVSDFVIAYVPTNVYSVGTVHEIVMARQQHKPVLFVSPPVEFPTLKKLEAAISGNREAERLVKALYSELPIKENPRAIPSLWYMPLIGSESFFDGFGFGLSRHFRRFPTWKEQTPLNKREAADPPSRPLIPFLEDLAGGKAAPRRWNHGKQAYEANDEWLLLEQSLKK